MKNPVWFAAGIAAVTVGCIPTIPTKVAELDLSIPQDATPVAIQAGIDKMDDPVTQQRIQAMMARPEMRAIHRELVSGLVDGALASLDEKERSARIDAMMSKAMSGVLHEATEQVPVLAKAASREAVSGALNEALSPQRKQELNTTLDKLVTSGMTAAAKGLRDADVGGTLSKEMTDKLGPAFKESVANNIAPGAAEMLKNEDLRRELGATARVLGREMVLGATEALNEKKDPADGSMLARLSTLTSQGAKLFGSAAWLLLLVIVALGVWVVKLIVQARHYRGDADRRAAAARFLDVAAKASEGKPWSEEMLETLRQSLHEEDIAELQRLQQKRRAARRAARRADMPAPSLPSHKLAG